MRAIGLTGGVGMGKSTSGRILSGRGIAVVDTDETARRLVEPGQSALAEIRETFGQGVIGVDGRLLRAELARLVFGDPSARRQLENILHPKIRAVWLNQLDEWRNEGRDCAVVIIPLLYETDASAYFDAVICTACTAGTQRRRLQVRGWTDFQIEQRIQAQWPAERKIGLADHVVWTEAGLDIHSAQLERIIA